MIESNNQYVNFKDPVNLAQYIAELTKQHVAYIVIKETDGSHSVRVTGY
jgi:hypothetical protein